MQTDVRLAQQLQKQIEYRRQRDVCCGELQTARGNRSFDQFLRPPCHRTNRLWSAKNAKPLRVRTHTVGKSFFYTKSKSQNIFCIVMILIFKYNIFMYTILSI